MGAHRLGNGGRWTGSVARQLNQASMRWNALNWWPRPLGDVFEFFLANKGPSGAEYRKQVT